MRFGIHTMDDFSFGGKTVLCRVDINQPVDRETGRLKDTTRIRASVPTLRELSDKGAKTVILAHQGGDLEYQNYYSTRPHAAVLSGLLGRPVHFLDDVCGPAAIQAIHALEDGELLLLDNVRFMAEEQTLFEQKLRLSQEEQGKTQVVSRLSPHADFYVCDAFAAAHRDQPTLCGFEQLLPSAMGRLFEQEYCVLSQLMEAPARPCLFVLGGAKIADAFLMMETVLSAGIADLVLTGGLAGNILLAASGVEIGRPSREFIEKSGYTPFIAKAGAILQRYPKQVKLPLDVAFVQDGARMEVESGAVPVDALLLDIGEKTAAYYRREILRAKTVFVNGPMGVFEQEATELGTKAVWQAFAETEAFTVLGGGDSITATAKYGLTTQMSYICTGGGALIRFLSGEELPVVRALRYAAQVFSGVLA